jgi:hypothetical protein
MKWPSEAYKRLEKLRLEKIRALESFIEKHEKKKLKRRNVNETARNEGSIVRPS